MEECFMPLSVDGSNEEVGHQEESVALWSSAAQKENEDPKALEGFS